MSRLRNRFPLEEYSTPAHFVSLLRTSKNIVVLTGAGISTNCGIPDFRSPSGIYARLVQSGRWPELSDPQEMFDMRVFLENPEIFYSFAKELYPTEDGGQQAPDGTVAGGKRAGKVHHWIRSLEKQGKLLRNYTQNIDTLEMIAGIEKVLHAHGEPRSAGLSDKSGTDHRMQALSRLVRVSSARSSTQAILSRRRKPK